MRARIAAWYTSSCTIGASLSFLFGRVGTLLGWRSAFVVAGAAGVALPRGESASEAAPQPLLNLRPVLANRDTLILIVGYAAAIWGCVGLRQWIVVFLTFCAGDQAAIASQAWIILVVGALISFLGVPAGLIGNELSIRYGLRNIATGVFLLSAVAGGLLGFTAVLPYIATFALSVVVGFICAGKLFQSHFGRARRCCPAAARGNNWALFLHRLWRRVPRNAPLRRHARPIRRNVTRHSLDLELRHVWACLPCR
jgi:Na+/melibiose symporter-like transporter